VELLNALVERGLTEDEAVATLENYREILDMVVDGAWFALNILGDMVFQYTTKQNHTVEITLRAVPE
jgi:hypothetical protein